MTYLKTCPVCDGERFQVWIEHVTHFDRSTGRKIKYEIPRHRKCEECDGYGRIVIRTKKAA